MNMKDFVTTLILTICSIFLFRYFFSPAYISQEQGVEAGQQFSAPVKADVVVHRPLNLDIDFDDKKISTRPEIARIETDHARYEFSTYGASLIRAEFKRNVAGKSTYLATLFPPNAEQKERNTFLVAFEERTPYYFQLYDKQETSDAYVLSYKATVSDVTLIKKFTIFKTSYRIDLTLDIATQVTTVRPRIFFASPLLPELEQTTQQGMVRSKDVVSGIVNKNSSIKIMPLEEQLLSHYWARPTLFGSQDRYFVHALVQDVNNFVQRGYYKAVDLDMLYSILEGPEVSGSESWTVSFYIGPKEDDALNAVDNRLEGTLNYGYFAFISKPLSKLVLDILEYLKGFVGSYGWAIIIFSILFKLLLLPFTFGSEAKTLRRSREFQKKMDHLQAKYKSDPHALADAKAQLLLKQTTSGMGGCLPILLQLPVFWALSIILSNAIQLYHVPFLWIPDLSAIDPYGVLPLLTAASIFVLTLQSNPDKKASAVIGALISSSIVGIVFFNMSAGVALYIFVSTFLSVIQARIGRIVGA